MKINVHDIKKITFAIVRYYRERSRWCDVEKYALKKIARLCFDFKYKDKKKIRKKPWHREMAFQKGRKMEYWSYALWGACFVSRACNVRLRRALPEPTVTSVLSVRFLGDRWIWMKHHSYSSADRYTSLKYPARYVEYFASLSRLRLYLIYMSLFPSFGKKARKLMRIMRNDKIIKDSKIR